MINKQKIILMTKMAVYDKNEGAADRQANHYFRHDYIYRKNMWTRLCAGIGAVILLAVYWLKLIFFDGGQVLGEDLPQMFRNSVVFAAVVLVAYSIIGSLQAAKQYRKTQDRLEHYKRLTEKLERINDRTNREDEEETGDRTWNRY